MLPLYVSIIVHHTISYLIFSGRLRGRGTWKDLLAGRFMWLLCIGYAVVFMIRTAAQDWSQLYLIQDCQQTKYMGVWKILY